MTQLSDMEELLSTIKEKAISDYMREAMSCYMTGAYRGCVVLCYIALFDDLIGKLEQLGKVNSIAKDIYKEASKKQQEQQIFESYLIDKLKAEKLIPELDAKFLEILRVLRNKSAHPSGHLPSAEEARFIFHEVTKRFLSQPILSTTQLVDEIISRLKNSNFFPSTFISDICDVVKEEIGSLHDEALPQLIEKLVQSLVSEDKSIKKNSGFFLNGLAYINDSNVNIYLQKKLIVKKSDDEDYYSIIVRLISSNGNLICDLSSTAKARLKKIIENQIKNVKARTSHTMLSHPVTFFSSLIETVDEDEILKTFQSELTKLFSKFPYSSTLIEYLPDKGKIKNQYIKKLISKAGSSSFDTANNFAHAVPDIDDELSDLITDKEAFLILLNIIKAAENNAFASKDLKNSNFNSIPELKSKAGKYCQKNKTTAAKLLKSELSKSLSVVKFLEKYEFADA